MKKIFCLMILMISINGVAFSADETKEGTVQKFYDDGKVKSEITYKDGHKEKQVDYYQSGVVQSDKSFKDGQMDGLAKTFYESGNLQLELNMKDGQRQWGKYYVGDNKLAVEFDEINHTYKEFHPSGKVMVEAPLKEGVVDGEAKGYYPDGKLHAVAHFKQDKLDGTIKIYYPDGILKAEYKAKKGLLNGSGKEYDEEGKIVAKKNYKNEAFTQSQIFDRITKQ